MSTRCVFQLLTIRSDTTNEPTAAIIGINILGLLLYYSIM